MNRSEVMEDRRAKDSLTGLLTRGFFVNRLEELVEQDRQKFTVFNIDLNKFKVINDLQGHHVGDVVLKEVGERLKAMSSEKLFFGRIGGDEFVGVYFSTEDSKINEVVHKIQSVIKERITHDKFEYEVSASIGVARFPNDATDASDLLKLADFAMYYAKKNEISGAFLITEEFNKGLQQRKYLRKILKDLDVDKDLELFFQPQFCANSSALVGIEAIVKWNHPSDGVIEREIFTPVAEEMGIVQYITKWTFLSAIAQIKEWNEKYGTDLTMNISVSQSCMYHRIFFSNVKYMIDTIGIKPHWLGIELNEYSAMHAPEYIKNLLSSIHDLGVKISIFDFGMGAICISYIKQFYVNYLKISPKLVKGSAGDENKAKTINGIIALAKGMDLSAVACGIDNKLELDLLKKLKCDIMQGDHVGKVLSRDEFESAYFKKS